jgi:hypothetical protein
MTALLWSQVPGSTGELADGENWTYLVAHDSRTVVLTRWHDSSGDYVAARDAALYAIKLGGVYPETIAGIIAHLHDMAQEYEDGKDLALYPAWRRDTTEQEK